MAGNFRKDKQISVEVTFCSVTKQLSQNARVEKMNKPKEPSLAQTLQIYPHFQECNTQVKLESLQYIIWAKKAVCFLLVLTVLTR